MAELTITKLTRRNRPGGVPPSAVEERVAWHDDAGAPVDESVATRVVVTYYDVNGSPVYTVDGRVGPQR